MRKRGIGVFVLVAILLSVSFVAGAVEGEDAKIDKAYKCLKDKIDDASAISFNEAVFGVMALGKYKGLFANITKEKKTGESCWPSGNCKLKDTALVLLAYDRAGESTTEIEKWLISKNGTTNDLAWFIEIDSEKQSAASCTIKWDDGQTGGNIQIDSNAKMTGNPGSCLVLSSSGYLLRVRDSCIQKRFDISCNNSFITTLLYQKNLGDQSDCLSQNGKTCYVIGETHSAASLGTTSEQIKASCFKPSVSGSCDYEGSLWTTLALAGTGKDISSYIPYLLALAEDNGRYFPDSFIYSLISDSNSFSNIINLRKAENFWEIAGSPYNRYYDTSLGLIALGGFGNDDELDKTKEYLLKIQTRDGCWNNNNIKDTAFILYSGWKRTSIRSGGGNGNTGGLADCLSVANTQYSCASVQDCQNGGGSVLENFFCSGVAKCCSVKISRPSCSSLNGKICKLNEECSQGSQPSAEGACCLGECEEAEADQTCQAQGGECLSSCGKDQREVSYSCTASSNVCCVQDEKSGGSGWWIFILVVLILLIILAIVYRHKIQMKWFEYKKKKESGKIGSTSGGGRPAMGPRPSGPMAMARPVTRPIVPMPISRAPSAQRMPVASPRPKVAPPRSLPKKNKELEDTLKKLKEMSK